jgi:lipopolysaccharide/colanic/teichoic acid biosynthesis glycosyltransferase
VKRTIDLLAAVAGLVILAPVFMMIAVLIRISSPGPIFFRQMRIGQFGKESRLVSTNFRN